MRHLLLLASLGLCLGDLSCTENDPGAAGGGSSKTTRLLIPTSASEPAPATARNVAPATVVTPGEGIVGAAPVQAPVASIPAAVAFSDVPPAPTAAQWTIYCAQVKGPAHIEQSRDLKRRLTQVTNMKDWYIVHGADESTVYYGFYRSIDDPTDPTEARRAQDDRHHLDAFKDGSGERPFSHCMFVELTTPNPDAPTEWDLTHAPDWAVYTVQVAAEKNSPDRKKNAVDIVRTLRGKGVEAYYFHGPSVSSVCIGLWPAGAIKQPVILDPTKGVSTSNANEDIVLVDPNLPQATNNMRNEKGQRVLVAQPKPVIVDERMKSTMLEYPYHEVNGLVSRDVKTKKPFEHSFVAAVPPRTYSLLGGGAIAGTDAGTHSAGYSGLPGGLSDPFAPVEAPLPPSQGGGRLKALDR